jgi:hypothetical protein
MKSFRGSSDSLVNTFTTLSQNSATSNGTLGQMLVNEQHKQLLLKYFDNEWTVTLATIGGGTLATLAVQPSGATSATLSTAWPNINCQQYVVFANGEQRTVEFVQNSTAITWTPSLTNAGTTAVITTQGVQFYPLPANVSKVKSGTITIGQLQYTPAPVQSIQEWNQLNALPYTSDIPAYFYIYQNKLGFWPIPSSSGNVITIQCQVTVPNMTYSDYSTGTLATVTVGSSNIVGSGTSWSSVFPTGTDLTFANLFLVANPPSGDGIPYQIRSFSSATQATLVKPIVNAPGTGATYTIGQYPYLSPDFHDAIVYGALRIYFSSIVKDPDRYALYNGLFDEKKELMKYYLGTKHVNVDLSVSPIQQNPNLYIYPSSSN